MGRSEEGGGEGSQYTGFEIYPVYNEHEEFKYALIEYDPADDEHDYPTYAPGEIWFHYSLTP